MKNYAIEYYEEGQQRWEPSTLCGTTFSTITKAREAIQAKGDPGRTYRIVRPAVVLVEGLRVSQKLEKAK